MAGAVKFRQGVGHSAVDEVGHRPAAVAFVEVAGNDRRLPHRQLRPPCFHLATANGLRTHQSADRDLPVLAERRPQVDVNHLHGPSLRLDTEDPRGMPPSRRGHAMNLRNWRVGEHGQSPGRRPVQEFHVRVLPRQFRSQQPLPRWRGFLETDDIRPSLGNGVDGLLGPRATVVDVVGHNGEVRPGGLLERPRGGAADGRQRRQGQPHSPPQPYPSPSHAEDCSRPHPPRGLRAVWRAGNLRPWRLSGETRWRSIATYSALGG